MNAKRTIAVLFLSAVPVLGMVSEASATQNTGAYSKTQLGKACKAAGGTSFEGSKGSGRYGCIKDNGSAGSDAITCDKGKGCRHEHFDPIPIVAGGGGLRPPTVVVTPAVGPIGAMLR